MWACEKEGEASQAIHVLDLMKIDGYEPNTATLRAAMWACVKGSQQDKALAIFDGMQVSVFQV